MADATSPSQQNDDQSMEEILQSIRRIIAEEEDANPKAAKPETPDITGDEPQGSDVLELTDMVTEDGGIRNVREEAQEFEIPAASSPAASDDVLSGIDRALNVTAEQEDAPAEPLQFEPESVVSEAPAAQPKAPSFASQVEALMSDSAAAAASESFRNLRQTSSKPAAAAVEAPQFRNGDTVEDLVLEALKPMLKKWLDANLPTLVERVVQREVARLTRAD